MHYDIMKILLLPALVIAIAIIAIFQFFYQKGFGVCFLSSFGAQERAGRALSG